MGIKLASLRHTDVVVMAPALTETVQTQGFKLLTSPSRSPSLSLKNHLKKSPLVARGLFKSQLSNGLKPTGMNGHSPSNQTTYNINGLVKNLKNEFLALKEKPKEETKSKADANYSITQIGGYMMNSGYMGDPDMGIQKSSKEIYEGEKITPEDEQMLKNLSSVMNNEELASNPELTQNVEDIIKAISNLEGDIKSNEIESGPSGDIETIFDNTLFNEADIMNMCVDESLVAVNKDTMIRDRMEEIRKRRFQTSRKCDFLLRRLKKIQARTVGRHAAEEITGVIEYSTNLLEASSRFRTVTNEASSENDIKCEVKPVSFSTMSHFMRQMEHAVNQQTNTVVRNNSVRNCKYFGSGSSTNTLVTTSNGVRSSLPGSVLPQFPSQVQRDLESTTGELKSQLVKIQQDIDSDVTESSSGCESCDEFINFSNAYQHPLSIAKRASWKWAEERSMIASKWTWLQSQIVDLEYRIRQHNDIKKNIRAAKGPLKFVFEAGPEPTLPNGVNSSPEKSEEKSCSRTRGLTESSFAKRRLFHLAGIHRSNKKAARGSSLRCSCAQSLPGCGLCTGRSEPGQPSEPLSTLPVGQRVAYIDPGFHPILSFPQDVSASVHFNSVMKCSDWQSRASRIQGKSSTSGPGGQTEDQLRPPPVEHEVVDLQRSKAAALAVSVKIRQKLARGKRRRRFNASGLERYRHRRKHSGGLSGGDSEDTGDQQELDGGGGGSMYPSPVPSPASSSHHHHISKDKDLSSSSVKRKRENSYDIDNIVIPYSMASATRLEKLNYKEILTPKWRLVSKDSFDDSEMKNGLLRRSSHEAMEVDEDTSDEAHLARHERCQVEEKKKFLSYLKLPGGGGGGGMRGRAQRRTDSRADSSGPNTPDGMSPRDENSTVEEIPPMITSPPHTPAPAAPLTTAPTSINSAAASNLDGDLTVRKRTISGSQTFALLPPEVAPYEARVFPLSEETYTQMLDMNDENHDPYPPTNSSYQEAMDEFYSPASASTDSAESLLGEDPNDPEWTVSAENALERGAASKR